MECIALVRCGNCMRKSGISFKASSIDGRVPHRLLVEEAALRCDAFICDECECRAPYLVSLGQLDDETAA